jgi:hypothetical protein
LTYALEAPNSFSPRPFFWPFCGPQPSVDTGAKNLPQVIFGRAVEGALGYCLAESCFAADRCRGRPTAAKGGNPAGVRGYFGASKPLSLRAGIPEPCFHPFENQAPLEFSNRAQDRKDRLSAWAAGVVVSTRSSHRCSAKPAFNF